MSFFVGGTPDTKGIRMKLRIFGFSTLIPSLVLAGHFGGDTVFTQSNSRTSWKVDGASVRFFDPESLCLCEGRTLSNLRLLPTDSVKVQNPKPADTTSVFTIQRPNPSSSNYVEHKLWFHDSLWWKVRGRTGWWAMESELLTYQMKNFYTDTLAYRFRWSRIDPNRSWVQWIDSVKHPGGTGNGRPDVQRTHLLRCLSDTGCVVEKLSGEFVGLNMGWSFLTPFRFGVKPTAANSGDTLWIKRGPSGPDTSRGTFRPFRIGNQASLEASFLLALDSLDRWQYPSWYEAASIWGHGSWYPYSVKWRFRVSGVDDSVVQFGYVVMIREGIRSRDTDRTKLAAPTSTFDFLGRPMRPSNRSSIAPLFVHNDGNWRAGIDSP